MQDHLSNLPNPVDGDYAHDTLRDDLSRAIGAALAAGKVARNVTVSAATLGLLLKAYRDDRLDRAIYAANDFEGGDQWRGYEKTRKVAEAWGVASDMPDYAGPAALRDEA